MLSTVQQATLTKAAARKADLARERGLFAVPSHDDNIKARSNRNNDNDVVNVNDDDAASNDNVVVRDNDTSGNDGLPDNTDEPGNLDTPTFVGPRIVWAPRPDVCGPNNRLVMVRGRTRFDFEPAATTNNGETLYRVTHTELPLLSPRPAEEGC